MKIEKLIVVDGIIQNKSIAGITVNIRLIEPKGKRNVRTLDKLYSQDGCTVHDTGNYSPTAGDEMHAKYFQNVENYDDIYVGAHVFVDHDSITQVAPLDEKMYHAGDGKYGTGNTTTFALEICVNAEIQKSHSNAKVFLASYLLAYPDKNLFTHQDWSKKYCPRWILDNGGFEDFKNDVFSLVNTNSVDPKDIPSEWAASAWEKAINKIGVTGVPINDGKGPHNNITEQQLMVFFDRLGLLD